MKSARILNGVLCLVLVVLWSLLAFSRPDHARRNFRWIPQMEDPLAFETQRGFLPGAPRWAAGAKVAGTVARGFMPFTRELSNPFKPTPENLQRGAQVYAAQCFPCHGPGGIGDGPVTKRGVPAPPSLFGDKATAMTDGKMYHIITLGQNNMAAYASQIERDDRWRTILHVRALQADAKAAAAKAKEKAK
ncbi:MAG: hypothetical protein A2V88_03180 [Elusimicrobia bacterium RBG_16_66_12]|nr:MAG: hypothetical protein A2V88_03180 [Elusimicrobia bacterium RBG_16_66_12]